MSRKYDRIKKADEKLLPPLRWLTRAFSSIRLAVLLLTLIALYGVVASVPLGFLAQGVVWLIGVGGVAALGVAAGTMILRRQPAAEPRPGWAARLFSAVIALVVLVALVALGVQCAGYVNAHLNTDPYFRYLNTKVIYKLPAFEMTEVEFYAWWPMRLLLILFVLNMVWATIRRIEFKFVNLGVLTVHTGIVILAVGAMLYGQVKIEGDMLLFRPDMGGRFRTAFYDRVAPALYIAVGDHDADLSRHSEVMIPLRGRYHLPRYNDYYPAGAQRPATQANPLAASRPLDMDLSAIPEVRELLGDNVRVTLSAFFANANLVPETVEADPALQRDPMVAQVEPLGPALRIATGNIDGPSDPQADSNAQVITLVADSPVRRVAEAQRFAIAYLRSPSPQRWQTLTTPFQRAQAATTQASDAGLTAAGGPHVLRVRIPKLGFATDLALTPDDVDRPIPLGDTGYTLRVATLGPYPFPFVTQGYEGAADTQATVRVTGSNPTLGEKAFTRIALFRYPERTQDFAINPDTGSDTDTDADTDADPAQPRGPFAQLGQRSDPDPDIRIDYLDNTKTQYFLVENPPTPALVAGDRDSNTNRRDASPDRLTLLVRIPGQPPLSSPLPGNQLRFPLPGATADGTAGGWVHIVDRWNNAVEVQRVVPTPYNARDPQEAGNYNQALLAATISLPSRGANPGGDSGADPGAVPGADLGFERTVHLRHLKFPDIPDGAHRPVSIDLPDGRRVTFIFSRQRYQLPFAVALREFEMQPYPGSDIPRDYLATLAIAPVEITQGPDGGTTRLIADEPTLHVAQLNDPVVYQARRGPWHLRKIKLSQNGWDAPQSGPNAPDPQARTPQGLYANQQRFTILGVSNNEGIRLIATGGVLIAAGIPGPSMSSPGCSAANATSSAANTSRGTPPQAPRRVE